MNKSVKRLLAGPYIVWMIGFTIIPLLLIVFYGLTDKGGAFTLANVLSIGTPEHAKALFLSLGLSLLSTLICLVLATRWPWFFAGRISAREALWYSFSFFRCG